MKIAIVASALLVVFLASSAKVIDVGTEAQHTGIVAFDARASSGGDWEAIVVEIVAIADRIYVPPTPVSGRARADPPDRSNGAEKMNGTKGMDSDRILMGLLKGRTFIVLILLIAFFSVASPAFLSANALSMIAKHVALYGILALGMTFVIIAGGIDLSVGPIVGLVGCAIGPVDGLIVPKANVAPFTTTLGALYVCRGGRRT